MGKIKNFKELNIWQKGINLVSEIYKITKNFPDSEFIKETLTQYEVRGTLYDKDYEVHIDR